MTSSHALAIDQAQMPAPVPNIDQIKEHLNHLFGGDLGNFADGQIEIAWTPPIVHGVRSGPSFGQSFQVGQIDEAADHAAKMNANRSNVYVGVALRHPDSPPFGRGKDKDVYCMTTLYTDLDELGSATNAKTVWEELPPTLAVITGLFPHSRMHANWRLTNPLIDLERGSAMLKALAAAFGGDTKVTNPSRVLRLAGSIAWPTKENRREEMTFIQKLKAPSRTPTIDLAQLEEKFSGFMRKAPLLTDALPATQAPTQQPRLDSVTVPPSQRFDIGPIDDGREEYMRDTILAGLKQFIGENGAVPVPQELFDLMWAQYERNVDQSRPGRGPDEFLKKCVYVIERFKRGEISSMRTMDDAIISYQAGAANDNKTNAHAAQVAKAPASAIDAEPFEYEDPKTFPPRAFIYGYHYIRKFVCATIAPGGVGKSSLTLADGLAMATGKPLLGILPRKRSRVWIWNGEDPKEETKRRILAAMLHYGLAPADLEGWLFVGSGRDMPIITATMNRDALQISVPIADALVHALTRHKIDVMIVDPFVSTHRISENDNTAIDGVVKLWAEIAERANCAIELVHHSRKTNGNGVTVEDARGASALLAAARSARVINPMTKEEAAKAGVENNRLYIRAENGKANMAPPAKHADWFKLVSVPLGNRTDPVDDNGDKVAVVTPWKWPDLTANVTGADAEKACSILRGGKWRKDPQAKEWAGYAIASIWGYPGDPKSKKLSKIEFQTVKSTLEMWEEMGMLYVKDGRDGEYKARKFYDVADEDQMKIASAA